MATLNTLDCLTEPGNTGFGSCVLDFKNIVGAIITPKGFEIDVASLQTNLEASVQNASAALRTFPFWGFEQTQDGSEDKTVQTMGTGAKHVVREGFNDWQFQYVDGGLSLHRNLRKFNGKGYDFFFVDSDNKIMGIAGSTATKIKAIPSDGGFFWANPWKVNDASKVAEYMVQFVFNVKYSNDLVIYVEADFDLPTIIKGLQDVVLSGTQTTGTASVTAVTADVATNLGDIYPTEIAAVAAWKAYNSTTGNAITVTGVTYNSTTKAFAVVVNTSDPDYPTSGNKWKVDLQPPATLAGLGIEYFVSTGALEFTV